jgi:aminobenzoyl-glutamate transport protein
VNLLSLEGLHRVLNEAVRNFTSFAPLGVVLVAMLGIGVAEHAGFIRTALRALVLAAPRRLLTGMVVLAGILSHAASDVGYVVVVPLAALLFLSAGRHPLVGLAAAFAGVSGGFSANLFLGPTDALLAGITQEAAHIVSPGYDVTPAANWYFMAASAVVLTVVGTLVTERLVAPRLGEYRGPAVAEPVAPLDRDERRGLRRAFAALALFALAVVAGVAPAGGFLRNLRTGGVLDSPLLTGVVSFIFAGGLLVGLAYGVGARTVRSGQVAVAGMTKAMEAMGGYLVLAFFAAQFVALFNWTNLGLILAVNGAETLRALGLQDQKVLLFLAFVTLAALLDLVVGSASAKWVLMAPVFVPMLMLLGYSPELTQAAYRIGDSVANIVTPLMSYFVVIVSFAQKYEPRAGIGTVVALMLPYSIAFYLAWVALLVAWMAFGWPLGPGAPLFVPAG